MTGSFKPSIPKTAHSCPVQEKTSSSRFTPKKLVLKDVPVVQRAGASKEAGNSGKAASFSCSREPMFKIV